MAKRNKYIQMALDSMGLSWNDKNEHELNTKDDLQTILSDYKQMKAELESNLEEVKEALILVNDGLETLNQLRHRIEVEEYRELNPNHRVF